MREFFLEGGFWMYPIALLGLVGVVLGAVALAAKAKGLALASLVLAAIVMLLGVGGMMWGRMKTDEALAMVSPEHAAAIREVGHKEANRPLQLAGPFSVLGALMGLAALTLSRQR